MSASSVEQLLPAGQEVKGGNKAGKAGAKAVWAQGREHDRPRTSSWGQPPVQIFRQACEDAAQTDL